MLERLGSPRNLQSKFDVEVRVVQQNEKVFTFFHEQTEERRFLQRNRSDSTSPAFRPL